jgi:hypothetical protein
VRSVCVCPLILGVFLPRVGYCLPPGVRRVFEPGEGKGKRRYGKRKRKEEWVKVGGGSTKRQRKGDRQVEERGIGGGGGQGSGKRYGGGQVSGKGQLLRKRPRNCEVRVPVVLTSIHLYHQTIGNILHNIIEMFCFLFAFIS